MAYELKIKDLFEDHKSSLLLSGLLIGSSIATDRQWADVISLLSSNYKFSITRDTFAGTFYADMIPKPISSSGIHTKDSIQYYVSYDGIHNQDAAVFKMLSISNSIDRKFNGSLYKEISHKLIYTSTKMDKAHIGIIIIPKDIHTKEFKNTWNHLYSFTKSKHTLQQYIAFMEHI